MFKNISEPTAEEAFKFAGVISMIFIFTVSFIVGIAVNELISK